MRELITGGARSGKSAHAEARAADSGLEVVMVVTAHAGDAEMADRIARHRAARPAHWQIIEAPVGLADALLEHAAEGRFIVVDCLTLWLSNLLMALDEAPGTDLPATFVRERAALLDALPRLPGRIALVSNEVGWGIVPMGRLSRVFVDEAGRLNQAVARACQRVTLVAAGLPLTLKP
ncbi:MAG: bifunctional adenosylcobinamide kinase/adenosylcobinamide-phosphate guanylyltransferase [Gammaproteobacteria bacterium]|jgi:adenosylcobinamide kinase / adenosylcobinamide-phosphate guanylyltransferase|nr:bifunctional adenosylcobinamide kinase/adenosylcobinamide-phosphate guanylyltransferase [Gammaproteobacteria bacterium]MBU0770362.1 bifunctional adenosylcobinamide kinase/adenosylcobinamide-phosphate guanylyltransferase [Gammaproteobacteria bacterium]MBU0858035.1 bifunctional adenosylcobinamide kinase/adenosylcobinamide-phosphate guanylyltransferase [Gammaproteobacteria bacterium]MBU1847879.1 bifunctional adenosylcobinamide kinase/adenosylcobinamide-phosphate guanylyltransferase [Gammaproteob